MSLLDLNLTKLISKPLIAKVQFAPGFGEEVLKEIESLLSDLWIPPKFQDKFPTEITKSGTHLIWKNASFYNILELLARANWIEDISIAHPKTKEWIALSGEPLYKRGFREVFSASAPLREDIANLILLPWKDFKKSVLLVPFSGTGTFAWEWIALSSKISPILYNREHAIIKHPEFPTKTWNFFEKRAKEEYQSDSTTIHLIDNHSPVLESSKQNLQKLESVFQSSHLHFSHEVSFENQSYSEVLPHNFSSIWESKPDHLLIPLHPPYGNRHKTEQTINQLYAQLGDWLQEWNTACLEQNVTLHAIVLCPDQGSWHQILTSIQKKKSSSFQLQFETKHFTQGGIDIRLVSLLGKPNSLN